MKKPQFNEAFPEAAIREGADELTLRADEVGTQSILSLRGGDRRWSTRTGTPSAKQSTKELKGKNGKSCIYTLQRSEAKQQELKNRVRVKKRKSLGNKSGLGQG